MHRLYKIHTSSGIRWRANRRDAEYRASRARAEGDSTARWEVVDVPSAKFQLVDWLNSLEAGDD